MFHLYKMELRRLSLSQMNWADKHVLALCSVTPQESTCTVPTCICALLPEFCYWRYWSCYSFGNYYCTSNHANINTHKVITVVTPTLAKSKKLQYIIETWTGSKMECAARKRVPTPGRSWMQS